MKIERITVSAVIHSTESQEKVLKAIKTLFPFEPEIEIVSAKGHYGNPIKYVESITKKKNRVKELWSFLMRELKDRRLLLENLHERVDENNILYLRIDKQKALAGEIRLSDGADTIAIKVKIVSYPSKKDKILKTIGEMVEEHDKC
jgi:hypothetical protein